MKFAAVVLAAAVSLPGFAQQSLTDQGRAALDKNDPGTAATLLEKAVEQNPNDADAHAFLGVAYGNQALQATLFRRPSLAIKARREFETAVQLNPRQKEARTGLLEYYTLAPGFLGGDIAKAREQAEIIRSFSPIGGHRAYAFIDQHLKQTDRARKELLDAVAEQPRCAEAHFWLGDFYEGTDKNYPAANTEFETAVKLDPHYMPAWFEIGHIAALTGANLELGEDALMRYINHPLKKGDPPIDDAQRWLEKIRDRETTGTETLRSR